MINYNCLFSGVTWFSFVRNRSSDGVSADIHGDFTFKGKSFSTSLQKFYINQKFSSQIRLMDFCCESILRVDL